jgi:hypothetical protein
MSQVPLPLFPAGTTHLNDDLARPGRKLTPEVLPEGQARLDQGESVPEISRQTGVLANTIHKAIRVGCLRGDGDDLEQLTGPGVDGRQPDYDTVYYADGHVRVYHGKLAALPRRYVARQKLCLRGTTDYWVNALDGRPFFLVSHPVDPELIEVLRSEIAYPYTSFCLPGVHVSLCQWDAPERKRPRRSSSGAATLFGSR